MSWPVSFPLQQKSAVVPVASSVPGRPVLSLGPVRLNGVPWIEVGNGLYSSCVALLADFGAGMGLRGAVVVGLLAWGGWRLAFGTEAVASDVYAGVRGMAPETVAAVIATCERDLNVVRSAIASLPDGASEFCNQVEAILARFRRDPPSVAAGRRFVEIYLVGVTSAVAKYLELSVDGLTTESVVAMKDLLSAAVVTAANQRAALRADAQLDLDLDVQVLRSRMGVDLPMAGQIANNVETSNG